LTDSALPAIWSRVNRHLNDKSPMLANHLKLASLPAIFGPNSLVIRFPSAYSYAYEACATERNVERIQDALRTLTGQPGTVRIDLVAGPAPAAPPPANPTTSRRKELMQLPLFRKAAEALGAQLVMDDPEFDPTAPPPARPAPEGSPEEA
jgi:DNA polymerase-3 subunit gamma/tau